MRLFLLNKFMFAVLCGAVKKKFDFSVRGWNTCEHEN